VGAPNIGDRRRRFFERINVVFGRRWVTNRGQLVVELESRLTRLPPRASLRGDVSALSPSRFSSALWG
jgi:hypothetical protein